MVIKKPKRKKTTARKEKSKKIELAIKNKLQDKDNNKQEKESLEIEEVKDQTEEKIEKNEQFLEEIEKATKLILSILSPRDRKIFNMIANERKIPLSKQLLGSLKYLCDTSQIGAFSFDPIWDEYIKSGFKEPICIGCGLPIKDYFVPNQKFHNNENKCYGNWVKREKDKKEEEAKKQKAADVNKIAEEINEEDEAWIEEDRKAFYDEFKKEIGGEK